MNENTCLLCKHIGAYGSRYIGGTSRVGLIVGAMSGEGRDTEPRRIKDYDKV